MSAPGRKRDARKARYMDAFGIHTERRARALTRRFMDQLDACKDEPAIRLMLGIGEQFEEPQMFEPVGMSPAVAERVRARAA